MPGPPPPGRARTEAQLLRLYGTVRLGAPTDEVMEWLRGPAELP